MLSSRCVSTRAFHKRLYIEEREWVLMAAVNIGALLEYSRPQGFLQHSGGLGQECNRGHDQRETRKEGAGQQLYGGQW